MKKALRIGLGALASLVFALLAFIAITYVVWNKTYSPALPVMQRATSPEALARGERLFRGICAECHVDDSGRARGKPLTDFPAFIGDFHTANLTSDFAAGVGAWTDPELARLIRTSIDKDGRARAMPSTGHIGDADVAAIIGFMRSGDPLFAPVADRAPPTRLTVVGTVVFTWMLGVRSDAPVRIVVPPAAVSVAYGKYAAQIYDCGMCHTAGIGGTKEEGKGGYAGGFEFEDSLDRTVVSPNITFDETGLGAGSWSAQEFVAAVRNGVTGNGRILRPPMPRFRYADDTELAAVFEFLKTVPRVHRPREKGTLPEAHGSASANPEALWMQLGCPACHGEGAPFRDKLKQSLGKPTADVASWIRDPQAKKPGTQMPTFRDVLDEPRSLTLAAWVQSRAAAMK
jgi:mono/diheme cytochrome c family protein